MYNTKITRFLEKTMCQKFIYSNAFNASFGKLTVQENKIFDFFATKVDPKNPQTTYSVKLSDVIRILNNGKLSARGDSTQKALKALNSLKSATFLAPTYKDIDGKRKIGIIFGSYFNSLAIYFDSDQINSNKIVSQAEIVFTFSKEALPFVLDYQKLGFGAYAVPLSLFQKIHSKKAYLLLKAILGRLNENFEGALSLVPQDWDIVFNGSRSERAKNKIESPANIMRDINRSITTLNKKYQKFFHLEALREFKGKNVTRITVFIHLYSDAISLIKRSQKENDKDLTKISLYQSEMDFIKEHHQVKKLLNIDSGMSEHSQNPIDMNHKTDSAKKEKHSKGERFI